MTSIQINVRGLPAPQGSKKHVGNGVMVESSKKVAPWRQDVKHAAIAVLGEDAETPLHDRGSAVAVVVDFYLPRPKSHYRTGANAHLLRDAAPARPATKPDVDKLLRSTLDALGEAGIWSDDAQVVSVAMDKHYADTVPVGARIWVRGAA